MKKQVIHFDKIGHDRLIENIQNQAQTLNKIAEEYKTLGVGAISPAVWDCLKSGNWDLIRTIVIEAVRTNVAERVGDMAGVVKYAIEGTQNAMDGFITKSWSIKISNAQSVINFLSLKDGAIVVSDDAASLALEKFEICVSTKQGLEILQLHQQAADNLQKIAALVGLKPWEIATKLTALFDLEGDEIKTKPLRYDYIAKAEPAEV